jgi:hypothetical protein
MLLSGLIFYQIVGMAGACAVNGAPWSICHCSTALTLCLNFYPSARMIVPFAGVAHYDARRQFTSFSARDTGVAIDFPRQIEGSKRHGAQSIDE